MSHGKESYQPRNKADFVSRMRGLKYMVEQQQETISMLMGVTASLAGELSDLTDRVAQLETRQPANFIRQGT